MQSQRLLLNEFFLTVQGKAFRQAEIAVGSRDDAMDIVQDAMIQLARKYSDKEKEWPFLFHRILQNRIRDWFRKRKVRSIFTWWDQLKDTDENDRIDDNSPSPEENKHHEDTRKEISTALQKLPYRQQQAFLLRSWWGYSVSETASIMNCAEGSVKTHYSRASQKLKQLLGESML